MLERYIPDIPLRCQGERDTRFRELDGRYRIPGPQMHNDVADHPSL